MFSPQSRMEYEPNVLHPPRTNDQGGAQPLQNTFKNANGAAKKRQQQTTNIVNKGTRTSVCALASLTNLLKGVTEPALGLRYVWEYRSPSESVPLHYQCKLCNVSELPQAHILSHVKGWKHSFKYLKRYHPDIVSCVEEEATKVPAVRKKMKESAAEMEKQRSRRRRSRQLEVIYKEPSEVQASKGLRGRLSDPMFPGEYPRGPLSDFPMGGMNQGYSGPDKGPRQGGGGDGFGSSGGRDGFEMAGLLGDSPERHYPDEFRGSLMGNRPMDRPADRPIDRPIDGPGLMGAAPDSGSIPATLLKYLDSFRIENENDAQIILKVTQKLTDVLMDYSRRSGNSGPSMSNSMNSSMNNNSSMSSMSYSSPPSRMPSTGNHYSDNHSGNLSGNHSGPSRYSDGPSRFYN